MARLILRERLYIPYKFAPLTRIKAKYSRKIYDESSCIRCSNVEYKHNEICEACPAYKGIVNLWKKKKFQGKKYIAIPNGNPPKIKKRLKIRLRKAKDLRPQVEFKRKLRFIGKLYNGQIKKGVKFPKQRQLVNKWLKKGYGLIESNPRTGKTVMAVYIICQIRQRTLIVASQELWLRQFIRTFRNFTNSRKIKEKYGKSPYILVDSKKKLQESKKYDIVLLTYQKFIQLGQQEAFQKYIKDKFSLVIVDECHQGNAQAFARFLGNINCRYKLGLTATPKRVDGLHFIVDDVLGPVVSRGTVTALLPDIKLWESGVGPGKKWRQWWSMERFIYGSKARNIKILKQVFADLRANPKASILIPIARLEHMHLLVKMINLQAKLNNKKRGEDWPKQLAQPFWRGMNRAKTLKRIQTYESRVTVAIARMVQMGMDIPEWTHVHIVRPMSSPPMFFQLSARCCTPYPKKAQPIVRIMIDPNPMSLGCFRKLFVNEIFDNLEGSKHQPKKYLMDKQQIKRAQQIVRYRKSYSAEDGNVEEKTSTLPF